MGQKCPRKDILTFENNVTSLSLNVENRLHRDAATYPGKTESSATPLRKPENSPTENLLAQSGMESQFLGRPACNLVTIPTKLSSRLPSSKT
jgi:hypothetical protein